MGHHRGVAGQVLRRSRRSVAGQAQARHHPQQGLLLQVGALAGQRLETPQAAAQGPPHGGPHGLVQQRGQQPFGLQLRRGQPVPQRALPRLCPNEWLHARG